MSDQGVEMLLVAGVFSGAIPTFILIIGFIAIEGVKELIRVYRAGRE